MDAQMLLEKSCFFDISSHWGVKLKIHEMDYPFLLYHAFFKTGDDFKDFTNAINRLVFPYMKKWVGDNCSAEEILEKTKDFFDFWENLEIEKIFKELNENKGHSEIYISVNNSCLEIKRFGNSIGIQIKSKNSQNEISKTGTATMNCLCKNDYPLIRKFLHRIECIIKPYYVRGSSGSINVDFTKTYALLQKICPFVNWTMPKASEIINKYIKLDEIGVLAGNYHGQKIYLNLIHDNDYTEHKTKQWRRGNVSVNSQDNPNIYNFLSENDIKLSVNVHNGLFPQHTFLLENFDQNQDVSKSQVQLYHASSVIYTQLCAMEQDRSTSCIV